MIDRDPVTGDLGGLTVAAAGDAHEVFGVVFGLGRLFGGKGIGENFLREA